LETGNRIPIGFSVNRQASVAVVLESVDDLGDGVEVTDVPASLQQSQDARQDRLTIVVATLIHYDVCHPRAYLPQTQQRTSTTFLSEHGIGINKTRHRASTSVYSLTFCVRVMSPERHHWKPAVQAAALMLRTPPVDGQSPASQPRPLAIYGAQC